MKRAMVAVGAGLLLSAAIASAAQHTPADTTFMILSGGTTCPSGTTQLYTGFSIALRNPGNGNLTEETRCWQTPPVSTTHVDIEILAPCAVCRFGH